MTREEAIALLKSGRDGIEKWNAWHKGKSNMDLSGANLGGDNLSEADLRDAIFEHANFAGANLVWAIARGANFSRADFASADLYAADLTGCDLSGVNLIRTNMNVTSLRLANLTNAISNNTAWDNLDLSEVKGLESIRHTGPSTVGIDTLFRSHGKIPESFLRGCGVPQNLIEYLPSLLGAMQPIQFYSCFISHSSKDKEFCGRLHSRMQQEKLSVWYDEHDMKGGRKLHDQINDAIRSYDKLLLVLSPDSMNSEWVKSEIYKARKKQQSEKCVVLFPIALCDHAKIQQWEFFDADTGKDVAREIREYYIPGDFQNWKDHDAFESAFAKLLSNLRASDNTTPNIT
jgi:hypothetical protein